MKFSISYFAILILKFDIYIYCLCIILKIERNEWLELKHSQQLKPCSIWYIEHIDGTSNTKEKIYNRIAKLDWHWSIYVCVPLIYGGKIMKTISILLEKHLLEDMQRLFSCRSGARSALRLGVQLSQWVRVQRNPSAAVVELPPHLQKTKSQRMWICRWQRNNQTKKAKHFKCI